MAWVLFSQLLRFNQGRGNIIRPSIFWYINSGSLKINLFSFYSFRYDHVLHPLLVGTFSIIVLGGAVWVLNKCAAGSRLLGSEGLWLSINGLMFFPENSWHILNFFLFLRQPSHSIFGEGAIIWNRAQSLFEDTIEIVLSFIHGLSQKINNKFEYANRLPITFLLHLFP